jgi:ABC-type spermidine/putrescine transport system permease subunit II
VFAAKPHHWCLLSALHAVDPNLERAALGLGASRVRVFWRIVTPIVLPGVLSAALFAFLASFDELLISLFLAGVRAQALPVRIWNSLNLQVEPTFAAVSAFLIAITTLILAAEAILRSRLGERRRRVPT